MFGSIFGGISENINNSHSNWKTPDSLIECSKLRIIGSYLIVLWAASFLSNIGYLTAVIRMKSKYFTPINVLILAWNSINFFGSMTGLPILAFSALSCRYSLGRFGCYFEGFAMYFCGIFGIYLQTGIAITRFWALYKQNGNLINYTNSLRIMIACIILSLLWPLLPLFGWSKYSLEGVLINCSVEWQSRSMNVISYNITIFILIYFLPSIILIYTNFHLLRAIKIRLSRVSSNPTSQTNKVNENRLTNILLTMLAFHMISWTPYAVVFLISAFIDPNAVSPIQATLATLFAKLSFFWPPLLSIILDKEVIANLNFLKKAPTKISLSSSRCEVQTFSKGNAKKSDNNTNASKNDLANFVETKI